MKAKRSRQEGLDEAPRARATHAKLLTALSKLICDPLAYLSTGHAWKVGSYAAFGELQLSMAEAETFAASDCWIGRPWPGVKARAAEMPSRGEVVHHLRIFLIATVM